MAIAPPAGDSPPLPPAAAPRQFPRLAADEQAEVRAALGGLHLFRVANAGPGRPRGLLSTEAFELVCTETAAVLECGQGDVIQREGESVEMMACVMDGRLSKFHQSAGAVEVEYLNAGDQIGQLHMITGGMASGLPGVDKASSTVMVDTDSARVVRIARADLLRLIARDPRILPAICGNLALALRDHVRRHESARLVRLVDRLERGEKSAFAPQYAIPADSPRRGRRGRRGSAWTPGDVAPAPGRAQVLFTTVLSVVGSMSAAYPLDVARTQLQREGSGSIAAGFRLLRRLLREEGVAAWYRGWALNTATSTAMNAVYHSAQAEITRFVQGKRPVISDVGKFIIGIMAGCIACIVGTPLAVVTVRMQAGRLGALATLQQIVSGEGFAALWNGLGPALTLSISPSITYYIFDELKTRMLQRRLRSAEDEPFSPTHQAKLTTAETLVLGATAKAVASALTFPLLMAKIRMGLYGRERYPSMAATFVTVLSEEGPPGLFKGVGMSLLRSVTVAALEFALRDWSLAIVGGAQQTRRPSAPPPPRKS